MRGNANVQQLIDTMRKRLCYQASTETRQLAESLKKEIKKTEPEIADVLVPNCIYRCGCPETFQNECEFFKAYKETLQYLSKEDGSKYDITNIQDRYEAYNRMIGE